MMVCRCKCGGGRGPLAGVWGWPSVALLLAVASLRLPHPFCSSGGSSGGGSTRPDQFIAFVDANNGKGGARGGRWCLKLSSATITTEGGGGYHAQLYCADPKVGAVLASWYPPSGIWKLYDPEGTKTCPPLLLHIVCPLPAPAVTSVPPVGGGRHRTQDPGQNENLRFIQQTRHGTAPPPQRQIGLPLLELQHQFVYSLPAIVLHCDQEQVVEGVAWGHHALQAAAPRAQHDVTAGAWGQTGECRGGIVQGRRARIPRVKCQACGAHDCGNDGAGSCEVALDCA
jgi:hypothetical protein